MLLATALNTKGKPKPAMWEALLPVSVPAGKGATAESGWREVLADGETKLEGEAFLAMNRFSVLVSFILCRYLPAPATPLRYLPYSLPLRYLPIPLVSARREAAAPLEKTTTWGWEGEHRLECNPNPGLVCVWNRPRIAKRWP